MNYYLKKRLLKMIFNDIEYFTLRLIRKYLFSYEFLTKYGKFVPYYKITSGQFSPKLIIDRYLKYKESENIDIKGKTILELGVGATNSTCYSLVDHGAKSCYAYEPYVRFNKEIDDKIIEQNSPYRHILDKVIRIEDLNDVGPGGIDIVFSNSYLQYIENLGELCRHLRRIVKDDAWMVHRTDYRDHFFKYPFQFYKFNKKTWRIINTGLSRLRISDHVRIFNENGFEAKILDQTIEMKEFLKFKSENKINKEFQHYSDNDLATVMGVVSARVRI